MQRGPAVVAGGHVFLGSRLEQHSSYLHVTWETKRGDSKVEAKNEGMTYVCGDGDVDVYVCIYIYMYIYMYRLKT